MNRMEILCPVVDKEYWVEWLLNHHKGLFEVVSVERYGLSDTCLSRKECVLGYAQWSMFIVVAEQNICQELLSQLQGANCDRLEVRTLQLCDLM